MANPKKPKSSKRLRPGRITAKNQVAKPEHVLLHRYGVRLVRHRHSGRRLPWHATTYAAIYLLLLVTVLLIIFASRITGAGPPQSQQGAVILSGTVLGPPPSEAATIISPNSGDRFKERTITVSGTCTQNLFIELFRNGAFAGQDICDTHSSFSIVSTLEPGKNKLIAKIKDSASQYGPDSEQVIVFYDVPSSSPEQEPTTPKGTIPAPFLVLTSSDIHGLFATLNFSLLYELNGGVPPYAISVDWGDDSDVSLYSHTKAGDYFSEHKYGEPGQYTVTIKGIDSRGTIAIFQTIVVVHGDKDSEFSAGFADPQCEGSSCSIGEAIIKVVNDILWPLLILAFLMTFSFWLGERLMSHKLRPWTHLPKGY